MRIRKMRKLQKFLLEEPRRYNQDVWIKTNVVHGGNDPRFLDEDIPPCGTIGCLAGAVWMMESMPVISDEDRHFNVNLFETEAAKVLGLDKSRARILFSPTTFDYCTAWPKPFANNYRLARTPQERAQVAVDLIEHFIQEYKTRRVKKNENNRER